MEDQKNIIQNLIFDISFSNKKKVHELQNRISRLFSNRLSAMLKKAFNESIPEELVVKFDTLTLDLGCVLYVNLENEIETKLSEAIQTAFPQDIGHNVLTLPSAKGYSSQPSTAGYLHLFEYFLLTGLFPWWAPLRTLLQLQEYLMVMFNENPDQLKVILISTGGKEQARKRLSYQFTSHFLSRLIQLLEPSEADFIIEYHAGINRLHIETPVVKTDSEDFIKEVWFFILTFLITEKGSVFSRKEFVKSTLKRIAEHFSVELKEVLFLFTRALDLSGGFAEKAEIGFLVRLISKEVVDNSSLHHSDDTEVFPSLGNSPTTREKIRWLYYFFQNGSLPGEAEIESSSELKGLFFEMIRLAPEEITKMMRGLAGDILIERMYLFAGREGVEALVKLMRPHELQQLAVFTKALQNTIIKLVLPNQVYAEQFAFAVLLNYVLSDKKTDRAKFIEFASKRVSKLTGTDESDVPRLFFQELQSDLLSNKEVDLLEPGINVSENEINENGKHEYLDIYGTNNPIGLIRHFIMTGTLPWSTLQTKFSIKFVLDELCISSPKEVLDLWKWAGTNEKCREHFLLQFPLSSLLTIISLIPAGVTAKQAFNYIISCLKRNGSFSESEIHSIETFLIGIIWEELITYDYETFNKNIFYIRAVNEICKGTGNAPNDIILPLFDLVTTSNERGFEEAICLLKGNSLIRSRTIETLSYDSVIEIIGKYVVNGLNVDDLRIDKSLQISGLQQSIEYFFINRSFPPVIKKISGFSSLIFLRSALLALLNVSPAVLSALLAKYYHLQGTTALLRRLFNTGETNDRKFLMLLSKLDYDHQIKLPIVAEDFQEKNERLPSLPAKQFNNAATPLLQKYYFDDIEITTEKRSTEVHDILDYFLKWNSLPKPNVAFTNINWEDVIKEVVIFLFDYNRQSLIMLLQAEGHFLQAKIRMFELFRGGRDEKERQIAYFLKPYFHAALFEYLSDTNPASPAVHSYFTKAITTASDAGITNEFGRKDDDSNQFFEGLTNDALEPATAYYATRDKASAEAFNILNDGIKDAAEQGVDIVQHFLMYHRLPDKYMILGSQLSDVIISIIRSVYRTNRDLLKSLLNKEGHNIAARVQLHEWLLTEDSFIDKELLELTNQFLQKDIIRYLKQSTTSGQAGTITDLFDAILAKSQITETKVFLQAIVSYQSAARYVVSHYDSNKFYSVVETLNEPLTKEIKGFMQVLENIIHPTLRGKYELDLLNSLFKEFNLFVVLGRVTVKNRFEYISKFFDYLDTCKPVFISGFYKNLQSAITGGQKSILPFETGFVQHLRKEIVQRQHQTSVIEHNSETKNTMQPKSENSPKKRTLQLMQPQMAKEPQIDKGFTEPVIEKGAKLYVTNAGLVLLHPFISTFFSLTGLVKDGKFTDVAAQHRSVHLLQYLASGTMQHEEHALVLNKILCGLPLEEPLSQEVIITEKEAAVAAELFKILFQRWEKVKNSSVEGFRQSFLQREGVLIKGDEKWTMQVEQRGYDILLQTLPWAYSMIRLPWMQEVLFVEWI